MSVYVWTVPGSPAPPEGSGVRAAETGLVGTDIWLDLRAAEGADRIVTPSGDWRLTTGDEALIQSLVRRLVTSPGEWETLPEYGCGARDYVNGRNTEAAMDELRSRIRAQFARDYRVERVEAVRVEQVEDYLQIAVTVWTRTRAQRNTPLSFVVGVQ